MQAVGRLGSYISRSVYSVSGPFHPFGGAVDIIVVEQPDGSYKSSPWYVRFGKFQGVLKTKEKLVSISVNGVEADFNMYLDHKGEAFFLKEVDVDGGESACSPPSSSGEDMDRIPRDRSLKSRSQNYDSDWSDKIGNEGKVVTRTSSRRSQILGLVFGRRSTKEEGVQEEENGSAVVRTESLERAEMAADLLDLRWSTNLASPRRKKDNASRFNAADVSKDEVDDNLKVDGSSYDETGVISHSSYQERESSVEENGVVMECLTSEISGVGLNGSIEQKDDSFCPGTVQSMMQSAYVVKSELERDEIHAQEHLNIQQCLGNGVQFSFIHEEKMFMSGGTVFGASVPLCDPQISIISEAEQRLFGDLDGYGSTGAKHLEFSNADLEGKEADCSFSPKVTDGATESSTAQSCSVFSLDQSVINDYYTDEANLQRRRLRSISSDVCINETGHELTRMVRSLPTMGHLSNNLEASDIGHSSDTSLCPGVYSGVNNNNQSPGAQTTAADVSILKTSEEEPAKPVTGYPPRSIDSLRGSRRSWPFSFRKSRSMKFSQIETNGGENPNIEILNNSSDSEGGKDLKVKVNKKIVKTLTPTSEQLASLNLKEGKNIVIFTFSTPMLGKQQVDARIFLWRWDTRIVISDVDGTITRSDLLGQVMPLVGMDWSQTGVAHLFSAIKDNGYQLLFLSARSISQSFHTRQFLFNIKQDGKALPDGPVVISPDGLFPSLFREVVRRAPHEFKIACLEDIKALFPADTNPFYAGFGNRDTDEFSYLRVGIPRGKIFIINPKGEIVVNRRVETKSYLSLHALVHGMFPTMSSCEQEDFNSWNFWKLPPPVIDL